MQLQIWKSAVSVEVNADVDADAAANAAVVPLSLSLSLCVLNALLASFAVVVAFIAVDGIIMCSTNRNEKICCCYSCCSCFLRFTVLFNFLAHTHKHTLSFVVYLCVCIVTIFSFYLWTQHSRGILLTANVQIFASVMGRGQPILINSHLFFAPVWREPYNPVLVQS